MLFSIIIVIITFILAINSIFNIILPLKMKRSKIQFCLEIIIGYFVKFFIPYVAMLALNIKVILRLRQSKRRAGLNRSVRQTNPTNSATDKGTRFTITTIIIDLIFLVFHLPETLLMTYEIVITYLFNRNSSLGLIFFVCEDFSSLLSLSYSTALVFMFIIFNRIFRKELFMFLRLDKLINNIYPNFLNSSTNRVQVINLP